MQSFLQPRNALQRASELLTVGQSEEAFETLHRTITDRKFRYMQWDASQQEEVVTQYAKLAVELDKIKSVREGFLQYRNHCQHTTAQLGPLIRVLVAFRTAAEARFAKAEAAKSASDDTEEQGLATLEADGDFGPGIDAAELLLVSALQVDSSTSAAREFAHCLRLVFEVYRTIMDIVKTTPKLQKVYHETAHKAFDFCRCYKKPGEFRRLCEMVRNNYGAIMKQKVKPDADQTLKSDLEDLRRPELHIETRLSQLKNAAELNLWKEAMQTMEDLYQLGIIELASKRCVVKSKNPAFLQLRQLLLLSLAAYYGKLAEVFGRSGFRDLHALGLLKWLTHTRQYFKAFTDEQYQLWASIATLAVIAVPVVRGRAPRSNARSEEVKRLTSLLGHPTVPTRASLVAALRDRSILSATYPCVQEFFEAVEGADFLPLTAVEKVQPLLVEIQAKLAEADSVINSSSEEMVELPTAGTSFAERAEEYVSQLRETVFRKLVVSLSGVYSTISIDFFRSKICPESFLSWPAAEHCLVALVEECDLNLSLDYVDGVIRLFQSSNDDPHGIVAERLAALSSALLKIVAPSPIERTKAINLRQAKLRAQLDQESQQGQKRLALLEQRRNELEHLQRRRDEDLEELAKERAKKDAEAESEKQRVLQEERQLQRRRDEAEAARLECATQLLKKMTQAVSHVGAKPEQLVVCGTPLSLLTAPSLVTRQVSFHHFEQALEEYQSRIKAELIKVKKTEHRKLDHLTRALRLEEAAALDAWSAKVKKGLEEHVQTLEAEREARLADLRIKQQELLKCADQVERWTIAHSVA